MWDCFKEIFQKIKLQLYFYISLMNLDNKIMDKPILQLLNLKLIVTFNHKSTNNIKNLQKYLHYFD